VSRLYYVHIVLVFFGMFLPINTVSPHITAPLKTIQDSVSIDVRPLDKREFGNLKDNYDDNEFIYERSVGNSGWWTRFKQWLSDVFKNLFDINSDAKAADITDIILKIFYVVIFLLVVFFIVKAIINKEGSWVFGKSSDKSIIPVTDIENNIYDTNFKSLIADAEKENNYRLAIRYYYLWLLKTLSEEEIIDYDVEKTNSDYYLEIENKDTKEDFSYTSYLYNYVWYGEFNIDDAQFEKAKKVFTQFLRRLWK
jgi:hypothetical protein